MNKKFPSGDVSKMKNQIFKKYNVGSEKELMKKLLGTSDKKEIKKILLNKLNSLPANDPIKKMVKSKAKAKGIGTAEMAQELLEGLSPQQRKQLKGLLMKGKPNR
ncbi:hypothetical protein IMX26_01530 [Clostridium sp. 'deep sea']|uniref:hypothetical protein n=1 Tax=Clostridium sp. 'deep sea' TaxID=2779445 RepID=UPI001896617C|nr:hypothetical protein [Clostridium sp. 'deep sea']QOR35552.1 hypothetical protein IMX26_01530 [Clostridium sp. 'deep sea']